MITGVTFVDLSAAYDTVDHRILNQKLYNTTQDSQLCRVFQNMLSNTRYYVKLNNDRSRWRNQKNGLTQGSVLSPILFNIYTNDQPIHHGTRNFIYAYDLCSTAQYSSFIEVETSYCISSEEQRGQSITKSGMEQDRTGEYPPSEVPRLLYALFNHVVVVYPLPLPLLVGGVRCSRLWSTSQLLCPSGQQCSHSGGVCPQIQGRQCGAYVGAVEEMMCVVCVDVTEGA